MTDAIEKIRKQIRAWYVPADILIPTYAGSAPDATPEIKVTDAPVEKLLQALEKAIEQRDLTGASWDDYNEFDKPKFDAEITAILEGK